jgi:hypothetical protein
MNGLPCQDVELKTGKYGGRNPPKTLEKLGCENYASKYSVVIQVFGIPYCMVLGVLMSEISVASW